MLNANWCFDNIVSINIIIDMYWNGHNSNYRTNCDLLDTIFEWNKSILPIIQKHYKRILIGHFLSQRVFSIRHRNGIEILTSKSIKNRKNISTSKYQRWNFDIEILTSKYCYVFQHFFNVKILTPFRCLIKNACWVIFKFKIQCDLNYRLIFYGICKM